MRGGGPNFSRAIEETLSEFHRLRAEDAQFSALIRLGEVELMLEEISAAEKAHWRGVLSGIDFQASLVERDWPELHENISKIRRLAESDRKLQFEELCLVLSLRLGVKCALAYLSTANMTIEIDALKLIDELLIEMAKDDKTRQAMTSAAAFISKNRGGVFLPSELLPQSWMH